jgi:hypothetical protein
MMYASACTHLHVPYICTCSSILSMHVVYAATVCMHIHNMYTQHAYSKVVYACTQSQQRCIISVHICMCNVHMHVCNPQLHLCKAQPCFISSNQTCVHYACMYACAHSHQDIYATCRCMCVGHRYWYMCVYIHAYRHTYILTHMYRCRRLTSAESATCAGRPWLWWRRGSSRRMAATGIRTVTRLCLVCSGKMCVCVCVLVWVCMHVYVNIHTCLCAYATVFSTSKEMRRRRTVQVCCLRTAWACIAHMYMCIHT